MSDSGTLIDQIGFLVGTFTGTEHIYETSWAIAADVSSETHGTFQIEGLALTQRHTQYQDGTASFAAFNVFTVDRSTGQIALYSFDSLGFLPDPPASGSWSGNELVLLRSTSRGQSRTRYQAQPDGYWWAKEFRASDLDDWSPVVDGQFVGPNSTA
jgi:hypothetical protein